MSFLSKIFFKAKNAERRQGCNPDKSFKRLKTESSSAENSVGYVNYGLGFNDVDFSDRVLHLEIENSVTDLDVEVEVETLNVSSLMLAAKSPFFHKLFKNGMKESKKMSDFTVRINASEKAAFMDMLNSIYERPLTASSRDDLVDVMTVADKFEVPSCAVHCVQLLLKSPMTIESALFYLEFPSTLFAGEVTRPIIDAAKQQLSSHFSGFTESQQSEAMSLPLCGIEAVVGGVDFNVPSEEDLLDFMLKWARKHYPDLEERRDILTNRLLRLICLPCLSYSKLMEIVDYHDFYYAQVSKLVFKALSYKLDLPRAPNSIPTVNVDALLSNNALSNCAFPRREYNHRRVVFFDIKKQDCVGLALWTRIHSEGFYLGGQRFSLMAQRYKKEDSSNFALFVEMGGSGSCNVTFEFSATKKPSCEFKRLFTTSNLKFTETKKSWGSTDLFKMPWTELIGEGDNDYIIDGVIHIRAQVTMNDPQ